MHSTSVPLVSLGDLLEDVGGCRVGLLKTDVEGGDPRLLMAYARFLAAHPACHAERIQVGACSGLLSLLPASFSVSPYPSPCSCFYLFLSLILSLSLSLSSAPSLSLSSSSLLEPLTVLLCVVFLGDSLALSPLPVTFWVDRGLYRWSSMSSARRTLRSVHMSTRQHLNVFCLYALC